MARTITIPDETYERLAALAERMHQTPAEWVGGWLDYAEQVADGEIAASFYTEDTMLAALGVTRQEVAGASARRAVAERVGNADV